MGTTTAPVKPTTASTTKTATPKTTTAQLMKPPAPKAKAASTYQLCQKISRQPQIIFIIIICNDDILGSPTEEKVQQLTQQTAELKLTIDNLEKERDFYFEKLQEVEKWAQDNNESNKDLIATLLTILYASNDNAAASTGNTPREETVEETETF